MRRPRLTSWLGAVLLLGGGSLFGCQSSALTSGKLYIKQEKYDKALEQLTLAVAAEPPSAEAYFELGRVQGLLGNYQDMVSAFARAGQLDSTFSDQISAQRRHYWAKIYNDGVRAAAGSSPDLTTARSHFRLATRVLPDHLRAWRNLAAVEYRLGEVDAAVGDYEYAVTHDAADTATARTLAIIYLSQRRYDDARQQLEAILKVGDNLSALANLAIVHMRQDHPAEAETVLRRALDLDPDCFECHYNLGNLYWAAKDYDQAKVCFENAIRVHPHDYDARYNLAITYLALEDLDAALPLLQALSKERPDNGTIWRELSRIYALQGHVPEAEAANAKADSLGY